MNTNRSWFHARPGHIVRFALIIFLLAGCSPSSQSAMNTVEPPAPTGTLPVQATNTPEKPMPAQETNTPEPSGKGMDIPASFVLAQLDSQPLEVSIEDKNKTTPQDVLREIDFSGGAGGGPGGCERATDPFDRPTIMRKSESEKVEWHIPFFVLTCGWQPGETVSVKLVSADGSIFYEEQQDVFDGGQVEIYYYPEINTPPGEYLFTFTGRDGVLQQPVTVVVPTTPRLYWIKDGLFLYQFEPDEKGRIFIYQEDWESYDSSILGRLTGWKEFQVNEVGQLKIQIDESYFDKTLRTVVMVIGEKSGQVNVTQGLDPMHNLDISLSFGLSVTQPTKSETSQSRSIWEGLNFRDLYQPGTNEYTLTVKPTEKIRWRYNWCAIDKDTLRNIMRPFSIKFKIDGVELNYIQIAMTRAKSASGWECNYWTTLLSNWKENTSHVLEIEYVLDEPIFDGKLTYPAGTYRQVINVTVE